MLEFDFIRVLLCGSTIRIVCRRTITHPFINNKKVYDEEARSSRSGHVCSGPCIATTHDGIIIDAHVRIVDGTDHSDVFDADEYFGGECFSIRFHDKQNPVAVRGRGIPGCILRNDHPRVLAAQQLHCCIDVHQSDHFTRAIGDVAILDHDLLHSDDAVLLRSNDEHTGREHR